MWRGVCVCVCVFTVESGSLQITSHPFNMVLLPTGLLSVWPLEWHVLAANFCFPQAHTLTLSVHHSKWGGCGVHLALTTMVHRKCMLIWVKGGECVWGRGVSVCVFTVESGSSQITCHPFHMVMQTTGLLSVWPWEWHVQEDNFCLPETHSESQGTPLKMGRMRSSPSPHHNGTSKMYAGLGGRGVCVCVCVCVFVGVGGRGEGGCFTVE